MKFRTRLLILLLTTTLLPLALSFLSQRASILHIGNKLAEDTRSLLNDNAVTLLHALVDDYGRILKRDKAMALLTLQTQAQAVESRFSAPIPRHPPKVYFSDDYSSPQRQPGDLTSSDKRQRISGNNKLTPIPVSYSQQVIFLAGQKKPSEFTDELSRMSTMPEVYRALHNIQPELFLWQYTALESGLHSSYPGKGGYPAEYDPRQRQWYRDAVAKHGTVQQLLTDLTTGSLILTLAKPLYTTSGKLIGVTALDIDYRQFFTDWKIPQQWEAFTESMVLVFNETAREPHEELEILLRNNSETHSANWKLPVKHEYLDITRPELSAIKDDILNGRSGVRKIIYQGQEALWAYGSRKADAPFPLVIVPYQQVLGQAIQAEKYVTGQIALGIRISAGLTVFVVIAVILLAMIRARKVTRPVMQLAAAAKQLADGNFEARVNIDTGDELENLGQIFNGLGTRLKERETMMQSLALAKEIQQQLLPEKPPVCPGFELAGKSLYCDETGGDYFDFIELEKSGHKLLGLAVGDVSGHGIGAALVMAAARGILRSLADRHTTWLTPLFDNLNLHLSHDTADAYFMTLFYGVIDPDKQTLRWMSAGHAPVFLYKNGLIEELESSGIPLGIIADTDYQTTSTLHFSSGDLLLIGTDGIWETRNPAGDMFGTERVCLLLKEHAALDAQAITEKIIDALIAFREDCPQDDDITLVVIKSTGP